MRNEALLPWIDDMSNMQIICRVITIRDRVALESEKRDFNTLSFPLDKYGKK